MVNLKIHVKNEAESKEAQELLFSMGCGWCNTGFKIGNTDRDYLLISHSNIFWADYDEFTEASLDEATLNDLRLMANHAPATSGNDTRQVLDERGKRYGEFCDVSKTSQQIQALIINDSMSDAQKEALQMIASKLARIANGDANYDDNWIDIAGYATLVVDELKK